MTEKKPPGWSKFLGLARKVVAVPKEKVDARIAAEREKRTSRPQKK